MPLSSSPPGREGNLRVVGVDPDGLTEGGEDSEDRAAMNSTSMPAGHTSAGIDLV